MFKQVFPNTQKLVTITFEGKSIEVPEHVSVAAAVLLAGATSTRQTHTGEERAPYCHMGICHECLMEIDGVPNQQACLIPVREGLHVRRQISVPSFSSKEKA